MNNADTIEQRWVNIWTIPATSAAWKRPISNIANWSILLYFFCINIFYCTFYFQRLVRHPAQLAAMLSGWPSPYWYYVYCIILLYLYIKVKINNLSYPILRYWTRKTMCPGGESRRPSEYTKGGLNSTGTPTWTPAVILQLVSHDPEGSCDTN